MRAGRSSRIKRTGKRSNIVLRALIIACVSLAAIFAVVLLLFINSIQPPELPTIPDIDISDEEEYEEDWRLTHALMVPEGFTSEDRKDLFFTFLIIGLNEGTNANTVMVASFDGVEMEANLISIPRDSLINVNRNVRKLSGGYLAGAGRGVAGGVAQMQREVRSLIGFVPDFYVLINYDAFHQLIDAIGGIEVDVPFHMRYDDPWQNLHINIPEGLQVLDGETALHFARFRRSNRGYRDITDFRRIENQQLVISKTIEGLRHPSNILRIPEFINIFNENIHTNLSFANMLWFASQLNEIRGTDAISFHTAPVSGTSGRPSWYEILNGPALVRMVNNTVSPFTRDIRMSDVNIIGYQRPAAATEESTQNGTDETPPPSETNQGDTASESPTSGEDASENVPEDIPDSTPENIPENNVQENNVPENVPDIILPVF